MDGATGGGASVGDHKDVDTGPGPRAGVLAGSPSASAVSYTHLRAHET